MKYGYSIPAIICVGFAGPVAAQSAADGFYTNGVVELEYFDGSGPSDTLGYANADFGITPSAGGFGFDLGVEALSIDGADDAALYGALSYSGGFGKVQIGAPRAVIDDYVAVPTLGGLEFFDLSLASAFDGSAVSRAYLLSGSDAPLGLRYDGTFGTTRLGASYHSIEGTDVINLAANYRIGEATLRGAVEHLRDDGGSATSYFLGAESQLGPVNAGILYSNLGASGDAEALRLYATYKPIDQLALTANVAAVDTGSSNSTLYGLSADYTFNQGVYVQAGVADGNSSTSVYNLSLGLKF